MPSARLEVQEDRPTPRSSYTYSPGRLPAQEDQLCGVIFLQTSAKLSHEVQPTMR
jgi:hypothetical protein